MMKREIAYVCDHTKNIKCKKTNCGFIWPDAIQGGCTHCTELKFSKNYMVEPTQLELDFKFEFSSSDGFMRYFEKE